MLYHNYYNFYNDTLAPLQDVSKIIQKLTQFIVTNTDALYCGFGAVVESSSYSLVYNSNNHLNDRLRFKIMTRDIHKDMYSLPSLILLNRNFFEGFPYLKHASFIQLISHMEKSNMANRKMLFLNIFYKDYLIGNMVFLTESTADISPDLLSQLRFYTKNIEALIYLVISKDKAKNTSLLLDTAESIVNSKHSHSSHPDFFMRRLLELIFQVSDEAESGSALLNDNNCWSYVHAIGHDSEALASVHLPEKLIFHDMLNWKKMQEVAPNIFYIHDIFETESSPDQVKVDSVMKKIIAACQPIKQTLQLHIYSNNLLKGIISLDIGRDTRKGFSKKTILLLKRINFIGQILFTHSVMIHQQDSFAKLTELISKLIVNDNQINGGFLKHFLKLLVESMPEADYATAYIRDNKSIEFLEAIGHDLDGLKALQMKPEYFVSKELIVKNNILSTKYHPNTQLNAALFSDLQKHAMINMPEEIYHRYMKASKPIKDGLISQIQLDDDVFMYISCDIRKDSSVNFSQDSIKLFSILNNLGFTFISNRYFIDKYQTLTEKLESIIDKRTMELEESNRQLKAIVNRDSLTGLLNHKSIIEKLKHMTDQGQDLSIFLLDIDHFKKVNDTYGHQAGDQVLAKLSRMLKEDKNIIPGRYGGEEFLIILPKMDLPEAITYCQGFLNRVEHTNFIENHSITVSGGVVTSDQCSAMNLIKMADTLLYEAKSKGRNQIKYNYC